MYRNGKLKAACHALGAVAFLLLTGSAHSASLLQETRVTRLNISPTSGLPEAEVPVPIYFESGGVTAGTLSLEITFPAKLLSFLKAEKSFLVEAAKGQIQADVQSDSRADQSTLKLTLSTPAGETPREFIPDGPIAYLTFRVAKEAPLDTEIVLAAKAGGVTTDDPPRPIPSIATSDGRILIKLVPLTACFFYMH